MVLLLFDTNYLTILTLGLGFIVLGPYLGVSCAKFYEDLIDGNAANENKIDLSADNQETINDTTENEHQSSDNESEKSDEDDRS